MQIMAARKTSLGVTFILVVAFTSAEETTSAGDDNSSSEGRIFELPATNCPEKCEINFPGRTCKVDLSCLMEILHSQRDIALEHLPEGGDGEEKCGGQCFFEDKQGNCRLDLICVLDGDFPGTCRFLSDCDISSFRALSSLPESSDKRSHCSSSNTESDCTDPGPRSSGSVDGDGLSRVRRGVFGPTSVTNPPDLPCPKKCMVRDPKGNCVVDYDCASMEL